jgi:ELWxxDGT repeat protein
MKNLFLYLLLFFSVHVNAQFVKFEQISQPLYVDYSFQEINGKILFGGSSIYSFPVQGTPVPMYETDGTLNGTGILNTSQTVKMPDGFADGIVSGVLNGEVYFNGFDSANGTALWKTDGTYFGTSMVKNINQTKSITGGSRYFTPIQNKLIFTSYDPSFGHEIYVTDGTNVGTFILKDIDTTGSSHPVNLLAYKNKVYFTALDHNNKRDIWVTDGTVNGTQKFIDLNTTFGIQSYTGSFNGTVFNNELYFISGAYLFKTDGTASGPSMLMTNNNSAANSGRFIILDQGNPKRFLTGYFLPMNGKLYFQYETSHGVGAELWVTDGTQTGTHMVKDITPGSKGRVQPEMAVLNDSKIVFTTSEYLEGASNDNGLELWVTDGTAQGTQFLKELDSNKNGLRGWPHSSFHIPRYFVEYNGKLYFRGLNNSLLNFYLWETDGTTAGTKVVLDSPLNIHSHPILYNNRMYWIDNIGPGTKSVLWQSEGTSTSTKMIQPIGDTNSSVEISASSGQYVVVNNSLVFRASYGDWQQELWSLTTTPLKVNSYKKHELDFTIYPNPCHKNLMIESDEILEYIELFDLSGRRLLQTQDKNIDVSQLSNGTYVLNVYSSTGLGSSLFQVRR